MDADPQGDVRSQTSQEAAKNTATVLRQMALGIKLRMKEKEVERLAHARDDQS